MYLGGFPDAFASMLEIGEIEPEPGLHIATKQKHWPLKTNYVARPDET